MKSQDILRGVGALPNRSLIVRCVSPRLHENPGSVTTWEQNSVCGCFVDLSAVQAAISFLKHTETNILIRCKGNSGEYAFKQAAFDISCIRQSWNKEGTEALLHHFSDRYCLVRAVAMEDREGAAERLPADPSVIPKRRGSSITNC